MPLDIKALGTELASVVKAQLGPLQSKISALEKEICSLKKQLEEMPTPKDGSNGIDGAPGRDGKDCDMEQIKALIGDAVKSLPLPSNGKDGLPGKDGKSVTIEDVQPLINDSVKQILDQSREQIDVALKAIPPPKDGRDGRDGKDGKDGRDGANGEKGADGIGIADAMIDRAGELVVTFVDGRMKNLGPVIGKDGRDGNNGRDGADFTDCHIEYDGERTITIRGRGGDIVKTMPIPMDKGYWREGMSSEKGDIVTHDGSAWIALKDTKAKPGIEHKEDWRLFARKGRDGERGQKGADGNPPAPIKLKKDDDGGDK